MSLSYFLSGGLEITLEFSAGILAAFLTTASGNIFNDIMDLEIDRINSPLRPLPARIFTVRQAFLFFYIFTISALLLAYFISITVFLIVIFTQLTLVAYSFKLKRLPFSGNLTIGLLTGTAFIYGAVLGGETEHAFIPAVVAGLANVLREVVKDIQDIEGDRKGGARTFPIVYGVNIALLVVINISSLFIFTSALPFFMGYYNINYLLVVFLLVHPFLIFSLKQLVNSTEATSLRSVSRNLKIIMLMGIVALYAGR
ncbi:MAG: geranylgeranylglycerol-phosphate geranylgeranyltransferase [Ignavibacteriaceae bacterium]|nr:geranylgeranylglycerol-phosphate geranylgeranyltransferase [Ignavibacteriaceae bacterium]